MPYAKVLWQEAAGKVQEMRTIRVARDGGRFQARRLIDQRQPLNLRGSDIHSFI